MTWWRMLWQRLRGQTPTPDPSQPQMWVGAQPGEATPFARADARVASPVAPPLPPKRSPASPTGERDDRPGPVVDGPITTPPRPVTAVVIEVPEPLIAPSARVTAVELLEAMPAPAIPDEVFGGPFELPDFSTIAYPDLPGQFTSPRGSARTMVRRDIGRSRFSPRVTAELVSELERAQQELDAALKGEPIALSLPSPGSTPQTYAAEAPPQQFLTDGREPRTLSVALPRAADGDDPDLVDALDRLELTRLVGLLLEELHSHELFTAGVDLDAFAYCLHPRPSIALLNSDRVRRVGGDFLTATVPADSGSSMDADRHGFAQLARQLLLTHDLPATSYIPGLDEVQTRGAHRLWERSAGPVGRRPQLGEWMAVLGS